MSYNINNYQLIKFEPIHDKDMIGGWQCDFTKSIRKLREQQRYDEVWQLIKEENNW